MTGNTNRRSVLASVAGLTTSIGVLKGATATNRARRRDPGIDWPRRWVRVSEGESQYSDTKIVHTSVLEELEPSERWNDYRVEYRVMGHSYCYRNHERNPYSQLTGSEVNIEYPSDRSIDSSTNLSHKDIGAYDNSYMSRDPSGTFDSLKDISEILWVGHRSLPMRVN